MNLEIFFEIHQGLPREGPGDFESTQKAYSLLTHLPPQPLILDLGCGPGMQTLDLVELSNGTVIAVDNHQPFLDQLHQKAVEKGVADQIQIVNADMSALEFHHSSFDVIWAEGSAYSIGFENALSCWKPLLKKQGYLAVTEISWLAPNPPEELQQFWDQEYPQMRDIEANRLIIQRAGYQEIGYFVLPESAWWVHYYTPLEQKLITLSQKYKDDADKLEVVELHQQEIDLYRQYSAYYGYVFYLMQV
ncbi:MAG: methyltransferase domain-containing protein [Limnoraphis robusta]|uniref:SAM-dependent methyltransferase n=2 Tax=Limnoraphis robusta TaxID=1118279 RepID=A0A0F5Y6D0_9CYAN|nr:class I SAM-dependent methyltransferase [Limnoraphis robusta]KKD34516.1 SAM-dependent methyltransferase [Limnoraphis robusta CS-951]MEA5517567.1 methyltransferase domain-containing protein [Limnoraphis robusta CCNP1315]MEA5541312.1 methyltransferase domain-containing protein [Limnoraphis robusta Tam1]MEA5544631.1 methyltransferase domain-containing protein [Limnoraphis robusta CCNP1324]